MTTDVTASGEAPRISPATEEVSPFSLHVPEADLDDLRQRLAGVRWSTPETVDDWSQGVPLAAAQELISYWQHSYDWRRLEQRLNGYPQFRTSIDGLGIHFIHVRSRHDDALPIVLTHGWPGSVIEFLDVIDRLVDPTRYGAPPGDAFHVVVPSVPGFGFSDKPATTGWNPDRIAEAWAVLMARLGYTRWVAQGGDMGAAATHALARQRPDGLIAAHLNMPLVAPDPLPVSPTPEEQVALDSLAEFSRDGTGYFGIQATRPQTIGYGLADSPVALALWIYEKLVAWSGTGGGDEGALTNDQMLDIISVYWFTKTGPSSIRLYWEMVRTATPGFSHGHTDLPMSATIFAGELFRPPRVWAEQAWPNLFYWNEVDQGGHFAAFEEPELFTHELQMAFRSQR